MICLLCIDFMHAHKNCLEIKYTRFVYFYLNLALKKFLNVKLAILCFKNTRITYFNGRSGNKKSPSSKLPKITFFWALFQPVRDAKDAPFIIILKWDA